LPPPIFARALFERYYQPAPGARDRCEPANARTAGLGLSDQRRRIVQLHGGELLVSSNGPAHGDRWSASICPLAVRSMASGDLQLLTPARGVAEPARGRDLR